MTACCSGSSNERRSFPTPEFHILKPSSHLLPADIMRLTEASSDRPYSTSLSESSYWDRNELVLLPQQGHLASNGSVLGSSGSATRNSLDASGLKNSEMAPTLQLGILDGAPKLGTQRLSLCLGSEIPSSVFVPLLPLDYPNSGLCSSTTLGPDVCRTVSSHGDLSSQTEVWKVSGNVPSDLPRETCDTSISGALYGAQSFTSSRVFHLDGWSGQAVATLNSIYLKPTQQLLDEIVNMWDALKHHKFDKNKSHGLDPDGMKKFNEATNYSSALNGCNGIPSESNESTIKPSYELSPKEQQDLQDKKSKLVGMLDEVDRLYRQYDHQMQLLVSSFEVVAGYGAAKPYTALALRTISRHFRCLRDTIVDQVQMTQKCLGEQDASLNAQGRLTRLRYVDQQLRQQRVLKHLGITRHVWRPQRGLPESAVSILRAWLFEHFLHPYPKDSEKTSLARQAGLSKGQVANWFINARVRLWKPMVEEMYKEEFNTSEISSKSSHEMSEEELQEIRASRVPSGGHAQHHHEVDNLNSHFTPDIEVNGPMAGWKIPKGAYGDQISYGLM